MVVAGWGRHGGEAWRIFLINPVVVPVVTTVVTFNKSGLEGLRWRQVPMLP